MSMVTQAGAFILVSLIVINGLLGGGVWDAIGEFSTEEETEQARADIACGTGYLLYTPVNTYTILGQDIDVPMPSFSNVLLAALIALTSIMIIRIATGFDWKFQYSIGLFITIWILIKILGYILMTSTPDCAVWAESMVEQTSGFYDIAALGGAYWGLKLIWSVRK